MKMELKQLTVIVNTFFFIGYIPFMPGTLATIATIPILFICKLNPVTIGLLAIIVIIVGTLFADIQIRLNPTIQDPQEIVIDEVAGMLVTAAIALIFLKFYHPELGFKYHYRISHAMNMYIHILVCFLLFRLFDIIKPFFIGYVDKNIKFGIGIMLDDILAGMCAGISFIIFYLIIANIKNSVF